MSSIVFDHVSKRYSDGFEAAGPVAVKTPEAGGRSLAITFASREHFTMARFDRHEIVTVAILGGRAARAELVPRHGAEVRPMIGPLLQLALVPASVALDVIFTAPDHEQEDPIPFRDHAYFVMCGDCEKEYARRRAVSQPWPKEGG